MRLQLEQTRAKRVPPPPVIPLLTTLHSLLPSLYLAMPCRSYAAVLRLPGVKWPGRMVLQYRAASLRRGIVRASVVTDVQCCRVSVVNIWINPLGLRWPTHPGLG